MKPFNLQEALAGKPVVTRDGRKISRVVHFPEASPGWRVVVLAGTGVFGTTESGSYCVDVESNSHDLFMASEKKEGWVNVYPAAGRLHNYLAGFSSYDGSVPTHIFKTEADARKHAILYPALAICRIEWEE